MLLLLYQQFAIYLPNLIIYLKTVTLIILLLFTGSCIRAQDSGNYAIVADSLNKIVRLIKSNDIITLAGMVDYPLKMPNPLPDLKNRKEFIARYPVLFDSALKMKLIETQFDSTNIFEHHFDYGIFGGDIWLNEEGKIITINYISAQKKELIDRKTKEIKKQMHKSVGPWKRNVLVWESAKFTIRIDEMENNDLRYISWSKPKTIADAPDLVIFGGELDTHGTMGGIFFTFKSKEWTYIADEVDMAESVEQEGLFLRVKQGNKPKGSYRCREIK